MSERRQKLVLVHPQPEFDRSQKVRGFIDNTLETFSGNPSNVIVLAREKLPVYINNSAKYVITASDVGHIPASVLEGHISDNCQISILGGEVGHCHRNAFESIVETIQERKLHDITFVVPFDGSYFTHGWTQWGYSWERAADPAKYRFDGILMGGYDYEMSGSDSYTLREVVTKVFGPLHGPNKLHRKLLRDAKGTPLTADANIIRKNIFKYFFKGYFQTPAGEQILKQPYDIEISSDNLKIHIK